jgi:DNA-binding NarL/FixJ family response regulator
MVKVLLAEDHLLVRKGLVRLLEEAGMEVLGEAGDGLDAVSMARRLKPDILLLDLMLRQISGLAVIQELQNQPETRIIVVSMYGDEPHVLEAIQAGAFGYIVKENSPHELIEAIHQVNSGNCFLSATLRETTVQNSLRRVKDGSQSNAEPTPREKSVLELAAQGLASGEIGKRLGISQRTVESHRSKLLQKLGLRSQTDLVRYAIRHGLIAP